MNLYPEGKGFPGDSVAKNLPANAGDSGSIPESGRSPGKGHSNPFHGQRSLPGYSPWGHKESDTTEQLTNTLRITDRESLY